jgi:signal transduction histidine kinase
VKNILSSALAPKLQLTIFRIIQEQLNNILKHAQATRAIIKLSRYEDQVTLFISDNGKGSDVLKEKKASALSISEAGPKCINGQVEIVSKPGKGYEMKIVLYLNGGQQSGFN